MSELSNILVGELLGTMFLIIMGNGVVMNVVLRKTKGNNAGLIVIAFGWGFAVFIGVIIANVFGTGGHINPAVTLANWTAGNIDAGEAFTYFGAQILGGFIGQFIVNFAYRHHIQETDPQTVLSAHSTMPTNIKRPLNNLFTEFVATGVLVSVALALSLSFANGNVDPETQPVLHTLSRFIGPLSMAFVVLAIGVSLGGPTGYAINPVRDLMPRIVFWMYYKLFSKDAIVSSDTNPHWEYAWIPVVAPLAAGAVIGGLFRIGK